MFRYEYSLFQDKNSPNKSSCRSYSWDFDLICRFTMNNNEWPLSAKYYSSVSVLSHWLINNFNECLEFEKLLYRYLTNFASNDDDDAYLPILCWIQTESPVHLWQVVKSPRFKLKQFQAYFGQILLGKFRCEWQCIKWDSGAFFSWPFLGGSYNVRGVMPSGKILSKKITVHCKLHICINLVIFLASLIIIRQVQKLNHNTWLYTR